MQSTDFPDAGYQRDEHRVHRVLYHLVWVPKRRKAVLNEAIARDCRELIEAKCAEKGWRIIELSINPDYVHLFVQVWPATSAAEVVRECKGITSRTLRSKYPELLKLPALWTRSYFVATVGSVSEEAIRRYIEAQKGQ